MPNDYNRDLEEHVLGAVLVAAALDVEAGHRLLDKIVATGLDPFDFYLRSLGRLYHYMLAEREAGRPIDALSLYSVLQREHDADVHVLGRLHALAHMCPAMTPAPHWAALVAAHARQRKAA